MIKYMNLPSYKNRGELYMFAHIYQFMGLAEDVNGCRTTILVHAYDCPIATVFKGYVYDNDKTYSQIPLEELEKQELMKYVGELKELNFNEFIKGTCLDNDDYTVYKEVCTP